MFNVIVLNKWSPLVSFFFRNIEDLSSSNRRIQPNTIFKIFQLCETERANSICKCCSGSNVFIEPFDLFIVKMKDITRLQIF